MRVKPACPNCGKYNDHRWVITGGLFGRSISIDPGCAKQYRRDVLENLKRDVILKSYGVTEEDANASTVYSHD